MGTIRAFLHNHRQLAALLLAASLCLKALVPGGYMIGQQANLLTITICGDTPGGQADRAIAIPLTGKQPASADNHGKTDQTCPYSALGMASLAGADAVLLAAALAFAAALGLRPVAPARVARASRLRPPLRGPPAHA